MLRLSCLARNGRSPGEESRSNGVAAQTIEAQPVFGQNKPSKRQGASRAEQQSREKMAGLGSARQEVGSVRRRKRNSGRQKRYCQREMPAASGGLQHRVYALGFEINANSSKRSEEARDYLSLKLDDPAFKMAVNSICKATRLVRATPCPSRGRGGTASKARPIKLLPDRLGGSP